MIWSLKSKIKIRYPIILAYNLKPMKGGNNGRQGDFHGMESAVSGPWETGRSAVSEGNGLLF